MVPRRELKRRLSHTDTCATLEQEVNPEDKKREAVEQSRKSRRRILHSGVPMHGEVSEWVGERVRD